MKILAGTATFVSALLIHRSTAAAVVSQIQNPFVFSKSATPVKDIPPTGLGLWNSKDSDATDAVIAAFKAGYVHLDSAAAYSNEEYVGKALHGDGSPDRSSYWITSKLWNTMHRPGNVAVAFNKTLSDLGVDYLDLYLMHWPVAFVPDQKPGHTILDQETSITDTWLAMEKLVAKDTTNPEKGTTRFIGISNFSPRQIDQILDVCTICPYAHEFETHPWLQQQEFVDWHHKHGIKVIAYSPLANMNPTYKDKFPDLPPILEDKFFTKLAKEKNVTVAQAVLGWGIARNTTIIPKSVHEKRIIENLKAEDVRFTEKELLKIAEQDKKTRFNDPSGSWGVKLFESLDG